MQERRQRIHHRFSSNSTASRTTGKAVRNVLNGSAFDTEMSLTINLQPDPYAFSLICILTK